MYYDLMNISERIRASGKSDKQIGIEIGVGQPVVWRWRAGQTSPNIANIAALAKAIGCKPADLIPEAAA